MDLACVLHVHSVHSDGTGTVGEIAAAARAAGAGCVIITDHDATGARPEAGWHGDVLVAVGCEETPHHGSHLLTLGAPEPVGHFGRTTAQVVDAAHAAGAVAIAAHPFSRGGWLLGRKGRAAPYGDMTVAFDGIEVWSLVTDTLERIRSPRALWRFARDPDAVLDAPPARNLAAWDALNRTRHVAGVAGLDAHQTGFRRRGRVIAPVSYAQTFALLRTHVLLDGRPADAAPVFAALRAGRAYMARDSLADATGFGFATADGLPMGGEAGAAGGHLLEVRSPCPAQLTLLRDGAPVARADGTTLRHRADGPGVFRVEARLRDRVWVLTNPILLR